MDHQLTPHELKLVTDPAILLTKNRIILKVYDLFGELAKEYKNEIEKLPYQELMLINAKISKGENYNGLPFVMLDFPRLFGKENTLAIRSFFWWGNFFSITLQLTGSYQTLYRKAIEEAIKNNLFEGWHLCHSSDQWDHHFEDSNYSFIHPKDAGKIRTSPFIKLAKKIPLQEWDHVYEFYKTNFRLLLNLLNHQAPMR